MTMTRFLFYLIVDKLNNLRTLSLHSFNDKIQIGSKSFLMLNIFFKKLLFLRYYSNSVVLCDSLKLYILEYHDSYIKYINILVIKSWGKIRAFEISAYILFSSIQWLVFSVKLTEIFEHIKGFGWVNIEWLKLSAKNLKDFRGMQPCYINIFWTVPS
jgi:hypothetical protein